jgi:polysaccharide pyruvyl transferase WcaK-like protein
LARSGPGRPRVGFVGILGSGNLGNDGSLEAVVSYLRQEHPDARLGFLCMGPGQVSARYGATATALQWYEPHAGTATGVSAAALKVLGKLLDPIRTMAWVRHYDIVIVPGMGVLEATLPLRPWALPYSLFWLGVTSRVTGTRVALLSVGSNVVTRRLTRWLVTRAARLADYRSFRDELSREAMREMGVDVCADEVYPDLVFALPTPPAGPRTNAVGVGVMAFYGGNDDRKRADELHRAYLETMKLFVRWLVDAGRQVRLFTGDKADEPVVAEILADVQLHRPEVEATRVIAESVSTLQELLHRMANVDTVVASRYHNVLCAIKLGKPTLSIGYAAKHNALMASMGLAGFCHSAHAVDLDRLIEQFNALEVGREALMATMAEHNRKQMRLLDEQFEALSRMLSPTARERAVPDRV